MDGVKVNGMKKKEMEEIEDQSLGQKFLSRPWLYAFYRETHITL